MANEKIFAERLRKARESKNLTQTELAEEMGYKNYTTISKWESGSSLPRGKELKMLSKLFDLSTDYLLGMDLVLAQSNLLNIYNQLDQPRQEYVYSVAEEQLEVQNNILKFPDMVEEETRSIITNRRSAAGNMIEVDDELANIEVLPASMVPKGADELVEITGASMEPLIKQGSEVYIRHQPSVENGEIAIVRIENEGVTCKRFYLEVDTVRLKSENEEHPDMLFDPSQVSVLGKVLL